VQANNLELKLEAEQKYLTRTQEHQSKPTHIPINTSEKLAVLKHRSILLDQNIRNGAKIVDRARGELMHLETKVKVKEQDLRNTKHQLIKALRALRNMARTPRPTIFIVPRNPYKISRSLTLLRAAVFQLKTEISAIQRKLMQMAADRQNLEAIISENQEMIRLVRVKEANVRTKIGQISTRGSNLYQLLGKLSQTKLTPHDTTQKTSSHPVNNNENRGFRLPIPDNGAPIPVLGQVVRPFGTTLLNGTKSKGITIVTDAAATVVAPHAGQIVFAGRFRSYGKLIIVELPNQGYALIAGMGKINTKVGDQVLIGEPLGEMPTSTLSAPELYFELRKNGHPVNPMLKTSAARHRAPRQG